MEEVTVNLEGVYKTPLRLDLDSISSLLRVQGHLGAPLRIALARSTCTCTVLQSAARFCAREGRSRAGILHASCCELWAVEKHL
jgi:hypothetical protein